MLFKLIVVIQTYPELVKVQNYDYLGEKRNLQSYRLDCYSYVTNFCLYLNQC